ncbi:response regulator [bacterium]|nr:response regulator [bacterium]
MAKNKILIVDDEPNITKSLQVILQKEGFITRAVSSGEEAIEEVKKDSPDLILLDLVLPGLGGIEALKYIKTFEQEAIIVIITAHPSFESAAEAIRCGAYDYIIKPYDIDEVLFTVKRAIEKKELQRSIEKMKKAALVGYMGEAMSHEIFNPLSIVSGSVQLLMSRIKKGKKLTQKEYEDFFKNITKNIERCVEIINIFRKFYASIGIEINPRNLEETLREILEGKI